MVPRPPRGEIFTRHLCLDLERMPAIINTEAVSVDRATFLATHTPMTNIAVERSPERLERVDEEQLIGQLRTAAANDRHVFMVVKGEPGTGKSHLVRWLMERFKSSQAHPPRDEVLLIERAHSSLRGTLTQLLEARIFDEVTSQQQLDRLRNAAMTLSDLQLGELLLNHLQVGALEGRMPDGTMPPPRIQRNSPHFLLDIIAREQLKAAGGPIDRIVRHLTEGRGQRAPSDADPQFEPDDFLFPLHVRQRIKDLSHQGVSDLAADLTQSEPLRKHFTRYLNGLLPFAIQRTTALSGEDLKSIFLDLRRALRKENRGLVLFIEDITAFTGIDSALLDVLVTQHTGEAGRSLCRMISVVGVTDGFFSDHVPDNIKDRMTHLIALKAGSVRETPIGTPTAMGEFVGRYLNALRLSQDDLDEWAAAKQADPVELPVPCEDCRYRSTCHVAFGAIASSPGTPEEKRIGLYPFNEQALWTMFQNLDQRRAAPTPRSLLRSVVQYVLQSHGRLIEDGAFPPAPARLGDDFDPPVLMKYLQEQTIQREAGDKAQSVNTLVRVWGNRTVDATPDGRVGGLPHEVFVAFDLPAIAGEASGGRESEKPTGGGTGGGGEAAPLEDTTVNPPGTGGTTTSGEGIEEPETEAQKDARILTDWIQGRPLQHYANFAERLARFLREAIDWTAYGVHPDLIRERLTQGRIFFDGQVGERRRADQLEFLRSPRVQQALLAIGDLQAAMTAPLAQDTVGGAVTALAGWLHDQEPRVVAFVSQPTMTDPAPMPLVRLALRMSLAVSALRGTIPPAATANPAELYLALIANSARGRTANPGRDEWQREVDELHALFPESLTMEHRRHWKAVDITKLRSELLASLQLVRGGQAGSSDGTKFLDAATALDEIEAFSAGDWTFVKFEANTNHWAPTWKILAETWRTFVILYHGIAAEGHTAVRATREELCHDLGDDRAAYVVEAIRATLQLLQDQQKPFPPQVAEANRLTAAEIESALRQLELILPVQGALPIVSATTTATPPLIEMRATATKIAAFARFVESELAAVDEELQRIGVDASVEDAEIERAIDAYDAVLGLFSEVSGSRQRIRG